MPCENGSVTRVLSTSQTRTGEEGDDETTRMVGRKMGRGFWDSEFEGGDGEKGTGAIKATEVGECIPLPGRVVN